MRGQVQISYAMELRRLVNRLSRQLVINLCDIRQRGGTNAHTTY